MIGGIQLRKWQQEGFEAFEEALKTGKDQLFVVAAVGAGKTMYAAVCGAVGVNQGSFDKVIVVAPQYRVKKQWAKTFERFKINLNYEWNGGPLRGYKGVSLTYAGLVENQAFSDVFNMVDERTLVIIDEVHHTSTEDGDDTNAWGKACFAAFRDAGFRLVLSGTPWRHTKEKVLFAPYVKDDDGRYWIIPDVSYSYGEAVRDKVNRPTKFHFFGGEVTINRNGKIKTLHFSEVEAEHLQRQALGAALDLNGEWVDVALDTFVEDLMDTHPNEAGIVPGGLVVCKDQNDARRIKNKIEERYGIQVPIVLSDLRKEGQDPQAILDAFDKGRDRILVSVGMVAEGVDIPRLTHCLYLSNVLSTVFLWQVLGRIVRTMRPRLVDHAKMYLPELPILIDFAGKVEGDIFGVAEDKVEKDEIEPKEPKEDDMVQPSTVLTMSAHGQHSFVVFQGVVYTTNELEVLQRLHDQGVEKIRQAEFARLLEEQQAEIDFIDVTELEETMVDREQSLRASIKTLVGRLSHELGMGHRDIHRQANEALAAFYGVDKLTTSKMTTEQLEKKEKLLTKKLAKL